MTLLLPWLLLQLAVDVKLDTASEDGADPIMAPDENIVNLIGTVTKSTVSRYVEVLSMFSRHTRSYGGETFEGGHINFDPVSGRPFISVAISHLQRELKMLNCFDSVELHVYRNESNGYLAPWPPNIIATLTGSSVDPKTRSVSL
jgi:hypothetical protein